MATKVRGITIEFNGDTTGLDKSLKDVNSEIKTTQKELKDVNKLLKLDPKNTELLQQKQKLLGDAVEETSKKLETLKKAQETMKANGVEQNTDQYRALQREIISTEQELKNAKDAAKEFGNVSLQKLQSGLQDVSSKAKKVQDATKPLSAAGAAVAGGLIASAVNAGKTADDLNTLAKQYGVTTAEIQKMNYAQDLIDVSTEDMLRSYSKMEKTMQTAGKAIKKANSEGKKSETVFDKLKVSILNADGSMRNANEVWYETLRALSNVRNETERDQLSMELFGKSAMELAGVIDDGGAALKQLGNEAERSGLILSQDALDSANKFNDALDTLKATATQAFLESGATLADTLIPSLEVLVETVAKVLKWFGDLDGDTQKLILTFGLLTAAISPAAGAISKVTSTISTLTTAIPAVKTALAAMGASFGSVALAVGGVTAAVALLIATLKNLDTDKLKKAGNSYGQFGGGIGNAYQNYTGTGGTAWHADAMQRGMILTSPTIFGYSNGKFQGAGEAGSETVVGTNSLYGMIKNAVAEVSGNQTIVVQSVLDGKVIGETAANYSRMKARANG